LQLNEGGFGAYSVPGSAWDRTAARLCLARNFIEAEPGHEGEEAADRFLDRRVPAVGPALFDECVDLAIQTPEIFVSTVFTTAAPVRTAKNNLVTPFRAAPAGLAGSPKLYLLEGGESAAKGIQNECAVASIMCDVPILDYSKRFRPPNCSGSGLGIRAGCQTGPLTPLQSSRTGRHCFARLPLPFQKNGRRRRLWNFYRCSAV
jgi:hypothetical protein